MLQLEGLSSGYGSMEILHEVSLKLDEGEIVCVIGPNGAGKSTLLLTISQLLPVKKGKVVFQNQDISGLAPHKVVEMGLIHVPEGRQLFAPLTIYENLILGSYTTLHRKTRKRVNQLLEFVFGLLPVLAQRRNQVAGTLSGGEQQMLAIGRGLMSDPSLLLLDEPSSGLAPTLVESIFKLLGELNKGGMSILLVEQNASVLSLAHRGYVLDLGRIVLHGTGSELIHEKKIKEVYLGTTAIAPPPDS